MRILLGSSEIKWLNWCDFGPYDYPFARAGPKSKGRKKTNFYFGSQSHESYKSEVRAHCCGGRKWETRKHCRNWERELGLWIKRMSKTNIDKRRCDRHSLRCYTETRGSSPEAPLLFFSSLSILLFTYSSLFFFVATPCNRVHKFCLCIYTVKWTYYYI